MFFQEFQFWLTKHVVDQRINTRLERSGLLWEAYQHSFDHAYYETWFDSELKRFTGIDVLAEPFDSTQGWSLFRRPKFEVFLMKYEQMQAARPHLEAFLERDIELSVLNSGERKWYAPVYAAFKKDREALEGLACSKWSRLQRTAVHFGYDRA